MALFEKKTTLVHHITYMGLMAAINLIFIVLATYIPFMMFLLILLLPFASTIVSYYCMKRYYIIYAVATVGLCFIFNIGDTLFYVVPAIASGFVTGLLLDKQVHPFWMVLSATIINAVLTYAFIPLIDFISKADIVKSFLTLFKLENFPYRTELVYLFMFFISLIQCALTHFVLLSDAKKLGIEINTRISCFLPFVFGSSVAILLAAIFAFFFLPLSLVFIAIAIYFAGFLLLDLVMIKKIYIYLVLAVAAFIGLIIVALFYRYFKEPYGTVLFIVFPLLVTLISFIKNCLLKRDVNI